jgi:hypothetical protein
MNRIGAGSVGTMSVRGGSSLACPAGEGNRLGFITCARVLAKLVRAMQQKAMLLRDERHVLYHAVVPYRLVPGVF